MNIEPAEVIPRLVRQMFSSQKCKRATKGENLQWRFAIGFRRFAALAFTTQPELFEDVPAWRVAEAIGISPAQFSRLCSVASRSLGGLSHPSSRSLAHRNACSVSRVGIVPTTKGKRSRNTKIAVVPANRYRVAEQVGVAKALKVFREGGTWTKKQVRLLFVAGYVDENGSLLFRQGLEALSS